MASQPVASQPVASLFGRFWATDHVTNTPSHRCVALLVSDVELGQQPGATAPHRENLRGRWLTAAMPSLAVPGSGCLTVALGCTAMAVPGSGCLTVALAFAPHNLLVAVE